MNINEFLDKVEGFFDIMHPNFCNYYVYENDACQLWKICEEFFNEMGQQI